MFLGLYLPWWAWGYLSVLLFLFFMNIVFGEERSFNRIISSAFSVFAICFFVAGFFNQNIADSIGYLVFPMVLIGVFWEFTRANIETRRAQEELEQEPDLTEEERSFLLNAAIAFNALVIVPGYASGLVLCLRLLGIM